MLPRQTVSSLRLVAHIMIVLSAVCFILGNRGNTWFLVGSLVWLVASLVFLGAAALEHRPRREKYLGQGVTR